MSVNEIVLSSAESIPHAGEIENTAVKFKHVPALDGLRGIAVLTVMLYHLTYLVPSLSSVVKGGFLGVDIFFVLSGFLITSILIREYERDGQISLRNFYLRRFFRLVPAFWTFLIFIYFFAELLLPPAQAELIYSHHNLFFAFSYLMNWHSAFGTEMTGNLNHSWSLAIEEQFYIIWSLALFAAFARKFERKQIFLLTSISILALIGWRLFRAMDGTSPRVLYYSTDTRIDALLIGCVAAMIYSWRLLPKRFYAGWQFSLLALSSLATTLVMIASFKHTDSLLYYGPISIFAIAAAVLILWLMTREKSFPKTLLELSPLRWVGKISYGLYLWHYAFYEFGKQLFESVELQIAVGVGLAFFVSCASFYLIEEPFLRLKDKFSS